MSAVLKYVTALQDEGKTVEKILKREYQISSGLLTSLKINGKIFINGNVCRSVDKVSPGDVITADVSENLMPQEQRFTQTKMPLDILFEDDYIIAVNKPGKLESHPCPANRESTLANGIVYYWAQKGEYHNYHIVNRLDKDTSGICVVAKNRFAHGCLSNQMKQGLFKKEYLAICHGVLQPAGGVINAPIKRVEGSVIKRKVSNDGKPAVTEFEIIKSTEDKRFSLAKIQLKTGRTHQIRVHFSHIGFPLVGDWLYGNGDNERELINRHALHATKIEFLHPETKEKFSFEAELPEEMKKLINL